ncbi:hypothetical protein HFP57_04180 [Parasphingopyxis algicola]|nr:hypothetical protein [Parasphingopyxis algicola]QLC26795.1 hypothetical protein HFP57_04180 [Parasphingopyxis algicola]
MKTVRSDWQSAILVCRKCSKRLGGGFGPKGKTRLAKALSKHLGGKKGRTARLGIVEVNCLSVCPKKAVTVVQSGNLLNWVLVKPGMPMEKVSEALGVGPSQE